MSRITRRRFMQGVATASGALFVGPHILRAAEPAKKLNFAFIGTGGRGGGHLGLGERNNCVAYCDVDKGRWPGNKFPNAAGYTDYRQMFDKHEKEIDCVVVATPDHSHAPASMMALRRGKHVYCEKPLTWSVQEARALAEMTKEKKVATQMGNQGHANEGNRLVVEWVRQGALGDVKEIHTWTNRPVWPQGIAVRPPTKPVPANLDWDNWIGPAPYRDFHDNLHSFNWRGWFDFGCGAVGDMGCHTWDCVFWAMQPDYPTEVELLKINGRTKETFPKACAFKWTFPAKGSRPGFVAYWYEGGMKPEKPADFGDRNLAGSGSLFIGTKASLYVQGDYGDSPRIYPEAKMQEIGKPQRVLERSPGHHEEWVRACRGEKPWNYPGSNFADYAGPITEVMLLGAIVQKIGEVGFKLECDPVKREVKTKDALAYIGREYRKGWTL